MPIVVHENEFLQNAEIEAIPRNVPEEGVEKRNAIMYFLNGHYDF